MSHHKRFRLFKSTTWKELRARQMRSHMTPSEHRLWLYLCRPKAKFPFHFEPQVIVRGYIADFYCHPLIIEVDGSIHNSEETKAYDSKRDGILRGAGFTVLRFSSNRIYNDLDRVLHEIERMCHRVVNLKSNDPASIPPLAANGKIAGRGGIPAPSSTSASGSSRAGYRLYKGPHKRADDTAAAVAVNNASSPENYGAGQGSSCSVRHVADSGSYSAQQG